MTETLGDGLHCTRLVVRQYHRHKPRLRPQQIGQHLGADDAGSIHRQVIDAEADLFEAAQRFGDGGVLDGTGDDMAGRVASEAEDGEVVGLGGAAGEDDLVGAGAEQGGDAFAGVLQGLAGLAAGAVALAGLP